MDKRLTYQTRNHFEWLIAITITVSLWTYTGYTDHIETWQPQSDQLEWVFSDQNKPVDKTISFNRFFAPDLSNKPINRSREYEIHIQAVHQSRTKVAMETNLEQSSSIHILFIHQQKISTLHSCEESPSDKSG